MKYLLPIAIGLAIGSTAMLALADVTVTAFVPCNNQNWEYSPRCTAPVEHFEQTPTGWKGTLTSGIEWTQDWVLPNMMEFKAEEMNWYVTPEGIIYKNN